ncbi:hypothetical protein FRC04_010490 [Tulasnella sp. 424]|nr:hypothetical protein FRC04_010490 [Tulasnella sp. 424]KAG8964889.1 hypothetical protein FRC05_003545 [Tulasnella sp. 425]
MLSFNTLSLVLTALVSATVSGASSPPKGARFYSVTDTYIGPSFLTGFDHQTFGTDIDPTHGRVNYTDQAFAVSKNLTFTSKDTLILRADYTSVLNASDPYGGRNSVRIQSKKSYGTSVTILDLRHMPQGCGTWPAFWTTAILAFDFQMLLTNQNMHIIAWPDMGEIDIIEGVNDVGPNAATLHTTPGCTMSSANMIETGTLTATDCNAYVNSNTGCSVKSDKTTSYGPALNAVGGGWYVMERTSNFVNIWFWARNDPLVPAEVQNGSGQVNPAHWGKPMANFVNNNCDLSSKMSPQNIIINLTFCGDWAGNAFSCSGSGMQACINYVNNNPSGFANAYWDIAALRVYIPGCSASTTLSRRSLDAHHRMHQMHDIRDL